MSIVTAVVVEASSRTCRQGSKLSVTLGPVGLPLPFVVSLANPFHQISLHDSYHRDNGHLVDLLKFELTQKVEYLPSKTFYMSFAVEHVRL
jgi:hypothetical protein